MFYSRCCSWCNLGSNQQPQYYSTRLQPLTTDLPLITKLQCWLPESPLWLYVCINKCYINDAFRLHWNLKPIWDRAEVQKICAMSSLLSFATGLTTINNKIKQQCSSHTAAACSLTVCTTLCVTESLNYKKWKWNFIIAAVVTFHAQGRKTGLWGVSEK